MHRIAVFKSKPPCKLKSPRGEIMSSYARIQTWKTSHAHNQSNPTVQSMHVMIDIMILFASFENGLCLVLGELKEKANCQSITLKLYRAFLFKAKLRQHRSPELG